MIKKKVLTSNVDDNTADAISVRKSVLSSDGARTIGL